jgi:aldose 1-epimerase
VFEIKEINTDDKITNVVLCNAITNSCAKISLINGGSLKELSFEGVTVITSPKLSNYETSYASAILFPFTNRIKKGLYTYKHKQYNLDENEINEQDLLHGLVYNKEFILLRKRINKNYVQVILKYQETEKVKGFPYYYSIYLTYTLQKGSLILEVSVLNDDSKTFLFALGWHPYFRSDNLRHSFLSLQSEKKIELNKDKIPVGVESIKQLSKVYIDDKNYDDCFLLKNNTVYFETPSYKMMMNTTAKENYLQIYTPNESNIIAIEPMTAPGNSFNNKMGLQYLEAGKSYNLSWKINFKNFNSNN